MQEFSKFFKKMVINREIPLSKLLGKLGYKGYEINRTCFCCFHENTDTKSAKMYSDNNGESLFCFSEQKLYRSSDAFELLTNVDLNSVFIKVWNKLTKEEKDFYLNNISSSSSEVIDEDWKKFFTSNSSFKKGEISYHTYMKNLLNEILRRRG